MAIREGASDSFAMAEYGLSQSDLEELQEDLVARVLTTYGVETIYAVWMPSESPYANLVRTREAEVFGQIAEIMKTAERQSLFLGLLDVRPESRRIVHAFRLCGRVLGRESKPRSMRGDLGIALLDDLVSSGQITAAEIHDYYDVHGTDLDKCLSVETNFRVGERVEWEGLRISDLGYIAVFQVLERLGIKDDDASIFAHVNAAAADSLGRVGVQYSPIAARDDLRTPTIDDQGERSVDESYRPVEMPVSADNVAIFEQLSAFAAPVHEVSHIPTIDLREPREHGVVDLTDDEALTRSTEKR